MARTIQLQLWLRDLLQFRKSAIALHVEGFDVLAEEKHRVLASRGCISLEQMKKHLPTSTICMICTQT